MTVSIWITIVIGAAALFIGFWMGRSAKWMAEETEARIEETEGNDAAGRSGTAGKNGITGKKGPLGKNGAGRPPTEWVIASPVSGVVSSFSENNKCGISIRPEQECLYAPVAGRVKKLYPMGNAMLISADFGVEVLLNVGKGVDELCNEYYRPRVMQSEVIPKGKLLLEFDKASLEKEGVDTTVDVSVEQLWNGKSIAVTQCERIKAGEALLWV